MRLLEKLSGIIFRKLAAPYRRHFEEKSLETILGRSLSVLDENTLAAIKTYIINMQTESGGFPDKAGKADLYYSLFGYFLADTLGITGIFPAFSGYLEKELEKEDQTLVHLHCLAILAAKTGMSEEIKSGLKKKIQNHNLQNNPAYQVFLSLLTCYYLEDYPGIYRLSRKITNLSRESNLPCSVHAALLILQHNFRRPVDRQIADIMSFYNKSGGFKATALTPLPDLLSTAVALYALCFASCDISRIKPECFDFVDSLYQDGGFGGNNMDTEPDIEYTFYGLLALGALA